jgi:hypothetical protein
MRIIQYPETFIPSTDGRCTCTARALAYLRSLLRLARAPTGWAGRECSRSFRTGLHLRSRGAWLEPASRWSAGCRACVGTRAGGIKDALTAKLESDRARLGTRNTARQTRCGSDRDDSRYRSSAGRVGTALWKYRDRVDLRSFAFICGHQLQHHASPLRTRAVLEYIDSLPGA